MCISAADAHSRTCEHFIDFGKRWNHVEVDEGSAF